MISLSTCARVLATYGVPTVISSVTIAVTAAVLLLIAIVALTTRRLRAHDDKFELGSVSQQWLLGHKATSARPRSACGVPRL